MAMTLRTVRVLRAFILSFALVSLFSGLVAADSKNNGQFGKYQPKDFLTDYTNLKLRADTENSFIYKNPKIDTKKYKKIMVERIKVWFKEDSEYKGIDPAEIKELTDYFHKASVDALGEQYPIVREPGPDVLRLRIAITDLVPNKPGASS